MSYADAKIYKVNYSRDYIEKQIKGELRLLQFIAVEVTVGQFRDEPVWTFYLRDCTEYVRAMKTELKADRRRMARQYEDAIVNVAADLSRGPNA